MKRQRTERTDVEPRRLLLGQGATNVGDVGSWYLPQSACGLSRGELSQGGKDQPTMRSRQIRYHGY